MDKGYIPKKVHRTFDGREAEIRIAVEFLQNESPLAARILLIHGPRGVGKTAFVWRVAHVVNDSEAVFFDKFKSLIWVDKDNVDSFLAACESTAENSSEIDTSDESFDDGNSSFSQSFVEKIPARAIETQRLKTQKRKDILNIKRLLTRTPYLLIVDDFDEEEPLTNVPYICEQLEKLSEAPNKVIITACSACDQRFSSNLVLTKLPIGLLPKQVFIRNIQNSLTNHLDIVATEYLWSKTGGLAEFTNRFLIPLIENGAHRVGGKKLEREFEKFVEAYLFEKKQPQNWNEYLKVSSKRERVDGIIEKLNPLAQLVLWSWVNLDESLLDIDLSEIELGKRLGIFMEEDEIIDDFHDALQELSNFRFILPRTSLQLGNNETLKQAKIEWGVDTDFHWILLPVIQEYLKSYWHPSRELLLTETKYFYQFLKGYFLERNEVFVIRSALNRCCLVFENCPEPQGLLIKLELGELICELLYQDIANRKTLNYFPLIDQDIVIRVLQEMTVLIKKGSLSDSQIEGKLWLKLAHLFVEYGQFENTKTCIANIQPYISSLTIPELTQIAIVRIKIALAENDLKTAYDELSVFSFEYENQDWVEVMFLLATKYQSYGDNISSFDLFSKLIKYHVNLDNEYVNKSFIQLAHLGQYLPEEKQMEVLQLLELAVEQKLREEYISSVLAEPLCWYAAYLEKQGNKDKARSILELLNQEHNLDQIPSQINQFVRERLIYLKHSPYPLLVDALNSTCTICKQIDKSTSHFFVCKVCRTYYHSDCLSSLKITTCLVCNSPIRSNL